MRRKLLSVVLCVCMMMTMAPFAFAAGETNITASSAELTSGTYILEDNVTLTSDALTIPTGANVTIKLNGKKLTNKDGKHTIINNGTLTITGSGTVDNTSNGTAALYNNAGATATLNGGTYTRSKEAGKSADNSGGNSYYTLKNFGTMTINSGVTVNQGADGDGKYSSLVANGWQNGSTAGNPGKEPAVTSSGAQMTINGGTFSGGLNTIKNDDYGTIIINGGTFQNYAQACFLNWNKATVNGGNFNGAESANAAILNGYGDDTMDTGTLSVTGGIFSGAVGVKAMTNNTTADLKNVAVSGGVFSSLESSLVATGYTSANIDGKTVVVTNGATAVAKIGDNGFASAQNAFDAVQDDETITLLADCSAGTYNEAYIPADKSVTLDLNGKTLTIGADCGIELQGKLTVTGNGKITCANTPICVDGSSAELTVNDGTIESTNGYGIYAENGGSVVVNGGTISSQYAALSGNNTTGSMNFTVKSGTLTAAQGPAIYMPGQVSLNISGGTLNGGVSLRMGQVNISGGVINAMTDVQAIDMPTGTVNDKPAYTYSGNVWFPDALYVIGGTYTSENTTYNNSLNLNITGGTFNCANGKGSAVAIYDLAKVEQTAKVEISGNAKFSTNASDRCAYQVLSLTDLGVENPAAGYNQNNLVGKVTSSITGGYFTTDPSAYCVENKTGVATGKADYPYTVGEKKADSQPATVDSATVPAKTTSNNDTVKEVASSISGATVENNNATEAATKDIANENKITADTNISTDSQEKKVSAALNEKVSDANKTTDANPVAIVYQTYVDVTVTDAKKSDTSGTTALSELSVELTPMYRVVATTKNVAESTTTEIKLAGNGVTDANAIQIGEPQKLNVPDQEYIIKLALPSNLDTAGGKLSIKHTKENGSIEYYTGTVSTEGKAPNTKTYVTFTTNGFSPFVIYAASANVASIGEGENQKVYPTLQAAIDAVQNNETITLLKATNENVTVSKAIKFTLAGKDYLKGSISAGSRYSMTTSETTSDNTKYTFTYVGGGSSSSISTPTTYAVNVNAATNGAVAADKKTASKGTTVTVTASPSKGYVVDAVKVVDKDGKDVAVTEKDGKYVFTMPASAVTVTGSFKAETPAPVALPFTDVKSGNWFYDAVKYAYEQGLMTGTSATTFAPNGTMNRAMIVTVLYRLEKSPAVTGASKFTDVPAGQWYSDAVAWAAANKIVNGYDETTFGPMNAVTREQMAAILFRYEQVKGLENVTLEENLNRFPDQNKISAYAIPALQWAVGQKIINGNADGTLDPTGTATRAQVAQIFTNLLNK